MNKNSPTEAKFRAEAQARGFEIYHKGYPDYCLVRGDTAVFVEVKRSTVKSGKKRGFSRHQRTMMTILTRLGIKCTAYYGDDSFWNKLEVSPLTTPKIREDKE